MRATSQAAAESIDPLPLREQVYSWLQTRGMFGATDEEMQLTLGMNPSTQRPRRLELVKAGRVFAPGKERKTQSGRSAIVWVAK